jgi:hypothetical protein
MPSFTALPEFEGFFIGRANRPGEPTSNLFKLLRWSLNR